MIKTKWQYDWISGWKYEIDKNSGKILRSEKMQESEQYTKMAETILCPLRKEEK